MGWYLEGRRPAMTGSELWQENVRAISHKSGSRSERIFCRVSDVCSTFTLTLGQPSW